MTSDPLNAEQINILRRAKNAPVEYASGDISVETGQAFLSLTQAGYLAAEQTHTSADLGKNRFRYTWTGKSFE